MVLPQKDTLSDICSNKCKHASKHTADSDQTKPTADSDQL